MTALLGAFTDGYSTYAGCKSPVEHFTRVAAKEFGSRGNQRLDGGHWITGQTVFANGGYTTR